jgi:hypothetical protein
MSAVSSRAVALLAACPALGAVVACSDLLGITGFTGAEEDSGAPPTRDGSSSGGGESGSEGGGAAITFRGYATAADPGTSVQILAPSLPWAQSTGDLIVVLINYGPALSVSQISDRSGNPYALFGSPIANASYREAMYYCLSANAAGAGDNAVTVALSAVGSKGDFSVAVFGFAAPGHAWTQDRYVNDSQADASAITSGGVSTSYANEVLVSGTGVDNYATAGSGGSWIMEPTDGLGDLQEYLIVSSLQTNIAATFTQSPTPGNALSQLGTFAARP